MFELSLQLRQFKAGQSRGELEDFLHSIQEKRPPLVSGEDAVETLRVAIAATESHRTGKLVQLT